MTLNAKNVLQVAVNLLQNISQAYRKILQVGLRRRTMTSPLSVKNFSRRPGGTRHPRMSAVHNALVQHALQHWGVQNKVVDNDS
jgi:hypothetical protein